MPKCDTCMRWFNTDQAQYQHMRDKNHFKYHCRGPYCDETYPTKSLRTEHEEDDHNYCGECQRSFQNYNNLQMHRRSRIHVGTKMACPFCQTLHTTATGLTHHLECGSCPNAPLDRDKLFHAVRAKDPKGLISKKLIGWTGSETYQATERAWNGVCWECYFCHRGFGALAALNQHLASPAHQQALYHCPNAACRKDFITLGALVNHLESETCGAMRFEKIQTNVNNFIRGGRLLTG